MAADATSVPAHHVVENETESHVTSGGTVNDEPEADASHGDEGDDLVPSCGIVTRSKLCGYDFWRQTLLAARFVLAPMVDASELAWRLLSRRYGAQLCYTPMLHANVFVRDARYRSESLQSCAEDRPLIVQFCANDPDVLCKAALLAAPYCDAVDLNLGCPQAIARRGNYGAFLQDEWELIERIVRRCHQYVPVPVTAKIRVFPDVEKTVRYARMLEAAGVQLLTVHGRTRDQKGRQTGLASWSHIKAIKQALKIPVFANGNIQFLEDVEKCIQETNVDGVMCAEGNLHNPALFLGQSPPIWEMANEYLAIVRQYPCPLSYVRGHLFKLCQHFMPRNTDVRELLSTARDLGALEKVVGLVRERCLLAASECESESCHSNNSTRPYSSGLVDDLKLPFWLCQPYERPKCELDSRTDSPLRCKRSVETRPDPEALVVMVDGVQLSRKKAKKLRRNPNKRFETPACEYSLCVACPNPKGLKCVNELCRKCCRSKSYRERLDCFGHNLKFLSKRIEKSGLKMITNAASSPNNE